MSYLQAVLLGIVQGLTEFLPVSSSAHLVIVQNWLRLRPDSIEILAFDMVSHLGTLLAVIIVFWRPAVRTLSNPRSGRRVIGLVCMATLVTGTIGLLWKDWFESRFGHVAMVGAEMLVTGGLLYATTCWSRPRQGWKDFTFGAAAVVGLAQAASILPGISRSGATICAAMMLGLRRRLAAEFSFLIATPAILGAAGLLLNEFFESASNEELARLAGPLLVGGAVAFAFGLATLVLLLRMIRRSQLHWFSYYMWVAGTLVIVASLSGAR